MTDTQIINQLRNGNHLERSEIERAKKIIQNLNAELKSREGTQAPEALQSHYENSTAFTVKLKDQEGNVYKVLPGKGIKSKKGIPFTKIKYPDNGLNTGWRKF